MRGLGLGLRFGRGRGGDSFPLSVLAKVANRWDAHRSDRYSDAAHTTYIPAGDQVLGAVILTKEKAEEISRKMVKEAKLSKEDANALKQELLSSGERQWKEMEQSLSAALKKAVRKLDMGKSSELQEIREKVENLEKRVEMIEESVMNLRES